ncbi:2289_t:CDS:2 [Entrophospora sp. SA101]|nr:2289_t:CDS:2 [Entrophospora sp. SA101]
MVLKIPYSTVLTTAIVTSCKNGATGTWIGDDREKWQMEISGPPSTPTTCHTVSDMKKSIQIDILNLVGILSNHLDLDVKIAKEVKVFS